MQLPIERGIGWRLIQALLIACDCLLGIPQVPERIASVQLYVYPQSWVLCGELILSQRSCKVLLLVKLVSTKIFCHLHLLVLKSSAALIYNLQPSENELMLQAKLVGAELTELERWDDDRSRLYAVSVQ